MMGFSLEPYSRVSLEENGLTEDPLLPTLEKVADNENRSDERMAWKAPIKYLISSKKNPWLLHLVILLTYTTIYLYMQIQLVKGTKKIQDLIYTPVRSAVEFEKRVFHITLNDTNAFNGPPSQELDDAWHVLLQNMNIRLSSNELKDLNKTSVMLADGSGDYMATIDAYHQLHCLQYIRQVIHKDHYTFHAADVSLIDHADHCIESLRQSIMCNPDLSILTYKWLPNIRGPWPDFETEHQCVNWDKIDAWSGQRAFNMFDPKFLVHPTLGPTFGKPTSGDA
ncbi:hypothetical protein M430DRAFT_68579 [Amorphotheca resinae ATCC 22711]|uniref:Uncharacterized protein n=1 Tax=Amorphotheca resinae ATCC 22711 TaxID=857342 RepID=A0A2T3AUH5_AMORE|nr:hypothetical protein M430DRAFT_68579 [Amorphotheca resinae ATCC 22711]PSS12325.1 hypothetical protein M430DRAFT_68579 [Amorphotheca resinae ATCC 22711]